MSLVKHDQILSSFNQPYYGMNYCVFSIGNVIIGLKLLFSEIL